MPRQGRVQDKYIVCASSSCELRNRCYHPPMWVVQKNCGHPQAHRTTTLRPSNLTYSSLRRRICSVVNWAHNGSTVRSKPLTNRRCQWKPTPYLLTKEAPVPRRQGPESVLLPRKHTLNGRVDRGSDRVESRYQNRRESPSSITPTVRPLYGRQTSRTAASGGGSARL